MKLHTFFFSLLTYFSLLFFFYLHFILEVRFMGMTDTVKLLVFFWFIWLPIGVMCYQTEKKHQKLIGEKK